MRSQLPIGIFDSGIGGLTVLQALTKALPEEEFIYFGDTARLPYGSKSPSTIRRYAIENATMLMDMEIKLLVVACNTASAFGLDSIKRIFNAPTVGVITPGAEAAVSSSKNGVIGIIGTTGTIASGVYQQEIARLNPHATIIAKACPLFVPLIEEGMAHHSVTEQLVKEYLKPCLDAGIDTLLLGCTHYPLLSAVLRSVAGDHVQIVDSASTCAHSVKLVLSEQNLIRPEGVPPVHRFFVSDDPQKFAALAARMIDTPLAIEHFSHGTHTLWH